MDTYKIIPDKLIDWIEQTKTPERYYRLILLLLRESNWGTGTYNDGVQVHKGQVRLTLRKLSQITGYSLDAVHRAIKRLQNAGWLNLYNRGNLTIITLVWLSKPEHLKSLNPNTKTQKPEHKPEQDTKSNAMPNTNQPEHKPEHKNTETRTLSQVQPEIRNKRNNIEVKEIEEKEKKNIAAAKQKAENFEKEKEEKEKENLGIRHLCEAFIVEYKRAFVENFGFYPQFSLKQKKLFKEKLIEAAGGDENKAKTIIKRLASALPKFFRLNDPLAKKLNYNLTSLAYNMQKLLTSDSGITLDNYDKPYSFKKSKKELLKEAGII